MKIIPISSKLNQPKNFKGTMVKNAGYHDVVAAKETGKRMEKGQAVFPKNKIYYADPLEFIDDKLKQEVDYIVYHDEPAFPDVNYEISKAFFYPEASKIGENVNDIRKYQDYFYSLEMADRKAVGDLESKIWKNIDVEESKRESARLQGRIADAQYNQKTAHEFLEKLHESHDLRTKNENNYYRIKRIESDINTYERDSSKALDEIEKREKVDSALAQKISTLDKEIKSCKNFVKANEEMQKANQQIIDTKFPTDLEQKYHPYYLNIEQKYEMSSEIPSAYKSFIGIQKEVPYEKTKEEQNSIVIQSMLNNLTETLEKYTQTKNENKKYLSFLKDYVKLLPAKINSLRKELELAKKAFEKSKADLIPYFDKLKNYMATRGLKIVK